MGKHKAAGEGGVLYTAAALLFLALCAWVGAALYAALSPRAEPPEPERAPEGPELTGLALRRELRLPEGTSLPAGTREGERLPAGALAGLVPEGAGSAVCFARCDGLERLSVDALGDGVSVTAVRALLDAQPEETASAGRLVLGRDWYLAALGPAGDYPQPGERCRLAVEGLDRPLEARVIALSEAEDGEQALLFRLTDGTPEALSLRRCRVTIEPLG